MVTRRISWMVGSRGCWSLLPRRSCVYSYSAHGMSHLTTQCELCLILSCRDAAYHNMGTRSAPRWPWPSPKQPSNKITDETKCGSPKSKSHVCANANRKDTHHSALAIIPPKEFYDPINAIRAQHSRATIFNHWMVNNYFVGGVFVIGLGVESKWVSPLFIFQSLILLISVVLSTNHVCHIAPYQPFVAIFWTDWIEWNNIWSTFDWTFGKSAWFVCSISVLAQYIFGVQ